MRPRLEAKQLSFLPNSNHATSYQLKAAPRQQEKKFMEGLQQAASMLGLPCIHVEYYCGNKFYVKCSHCGHLELATCNKRNNVQNSGHGDLIGIKWEIECKRDRNQRGDAFEPTDRQSATHEALRRHGVPVMVAHPGNLQEAVSFLQWLSKGKK